MPKIEPVAPIGGADALLTLLDLLQHPKQYATRLKELQALRDEINAKVELAGKAEAIPTLHAQAVEDRRLAAEAVQQARASVKEISEAAVKARDAARADADLARAEAESTRAAIAKEREAWTERMALREAALARLEEDTRKAHEAAVLERQQAAADRLEWTEKVERLRAAGVA